MSASTTLSELVSEDWQLAEEGHKPTCLLVQLHRCSHVFPWFRFVHAQGDDSTVKLVFASHIVTVTGHGLATLLAAIACQRVVRVVQPTKKEARFAVRGTNAGQYSGPSITDISVEQPE